MLDSLFELLANRRRRYILCRLLDGTGRADRRELAGEIAAWDAAEPASAIREEKMKRVFVSLLHHHLPKMEDAGVIEHDANSGVVTLTDATEFEPLLEAVRDVDELPTERTE